MPSSAIIRRIPPDSAGMRTIVPIIRAIAPEDMSPYVSLGYAGITACAPMSYMSVNSLFTSVLVSDGDKCYFYSVG